MRHPGSSDSLKDSLNTRGKILLRPSTRELSSSTLSHGGSVVLMAQHAQLKSLSLSFLQSETRGGKRCACIFVEHFLLEFPFDHQGERWRLRRQVQCRPRLPAKSCSLRGGRRGPQAGAEDPVSLPPRRRSLLLAGCCCVRLGCRGGGVVSLPPTSSHSLVFVAVGSPNAFLSTVLFHYIMSIM